MTVKTCESKQNSLNSTELSTSLQCFKVVYLVRVNVFFGGLHAFLLRVLEDMIIAYWNRSIGEVTPFFFFFSFFSPAPSEGSVSFVQPGRYQWGGFLCNLHTEGWKGYEFCVQQVFDVVFFEC